MQEVLRFLQRQLLNQIDYEEAVRNVYQIYRSGRNFKNATDVDSMTLWGDTDQGSDYWSDLQSATSREYYYGKIRNEYPI